MPASPHAGARRTPDSDISPSSHPPNADPKRAGADYFPPRIIDAAGVDQRPSDAFGPMAGPSVASKQPVTASNTSHTTEGGSLAPDSSCAPSSRSSEQASAELESSTKSSVASVSFLRPANPALPQGIQRPTGSYRHRTSSPMPVRFRQHVSFDNIPVGESTKNNTLGYTINLSHDGYQPKRRSRTMMVGIDQHAYSDYALQWLLEEYAEDGDEVVCVHVSERDHRDDKNYKAKAEAMVERIKLKIPPDCAISIKLEYAVGKLHEIFQKLIHVYQPSMLVVGTRGRSLGGIQGLVNTRNSFSKYCLQYSPVPTVVVRDIDKRKKKKEKRIHDPSRQSYASMLAANRGKHEADSENSSLYELEAKLSGDEEAHRVAAAIGLPSAFDPTVKGMDLGARMHPRSQSLPSPLHLADRPQGGAASGAASGSIPAPPSTLGGSDDEDSGDDDDDDDEEFEVISGHQMLQQTHNRDPDQKIKKTKLHQMEVAEAAALREHPVDDDEDDDDEGGGASSSK
ncbi:usp domain-containing protein [Gaeumannomyces tritici R3-111a-1]|uniref:Usp domain-containing protein n=1 Tax=Gaeumannomyces tritici (strain R3-111a-1) TaxID=644352 RepID=J3NIG7_GAET3|nr:usp domain-containing protein [Gaeumannomyces tritici R3-111a-1]EJT81061.1 usp domain-containing protein [Gaeumannomyces tritici R3-111a-1]